MPVRVGSRKVYIVTRRKSQTVNVCDLNNQQGHYDWTVRLLQPHFVGGDEVKDCAEIEHLIRWLTEERGGIIERRPSETEDESSVQVHEQAITAGDTKWIERATRITEVCIDELILEFLDLPYLHRVEHSIHCRLYAILSAQSIFARHFPLADGGMLTQPIHKEWPETTPRPEKDNRRGNFDLAILPPGQLRTCTLEHFRDGRVAAPIAIEMGLNCDDEHLAADAEKLLNSQIQHGYLVHLVREKPRDTSIDQTIERLRRESTIRVAFARVEGRKKYLKLLGDPGIREMT